MKRTTKYVLAALFTAIIAVLAQVSFPLPSGIPLTLQIFAVALCGFWLKWYGVLSVATYILLGLIGAPVFSHFGAGPSVLFGQTGGFIFGFLLLTCACSLSEKAQNKLLKISIIFIGIILCHLCGIVQFSLIWKQGFFEAFVICSAPFLLKDLILVYAALGVSNLIKKRIKTC